MPLTIRLSSKIQEALGRDAAEDLLNWMQTVDDRHADLRAFHELTTARFESRLDQAKAELRTEIAELRTEMRVGFAETHRAIDRRSVELMRLTVGLWVTTVVMLVGAIFSWLNLR